MSFLAPFLFAGSLMLVAPWLLHRIRKPQQQAMVFGSMMFVPQVKKKVLEKRSIQHWLLMLLRMLLLLILVLAFSRPYQLYLAEALSDDGAARHVILLDNSYSMGAADKFDGAKKRALDVVNSIDATERIGLIVFNQVVEDEHPVSVENESPQDNRRRIRQAIEAASLGESRTAYLPAIQRAQEALLSARSEESTTQKNIIHIVSDFQQAGMPERGADWRASSQVEFKLESVPQIQTDNLAVSDIALREAPQGGFRILGQIKNWTEQEVSREAQLVIDGVEAERKTITVQAGHSMKVSFRTDWDVSRSHAGFLQLPDDDLQLDNKRYFSWNPEAKRRVALLQDPADLRRWPASWFVNQALSVSGDSIWTIEEFATDELPSVANDETAPDALLAPIINHLSEASIAWLKAYLNQGGKAMVWIDPAQPLDGPAASWVASLGYIIEGPRFQNTHDDQFDILSWIDFDHAIFYPMRDMEFNDFTMVHFYQYLQLAADHSDENSSRVLACFDERRPALIEQTIGDGNLLLWTFAPVLDATNLPRNPKFVPIMFETLNYLIEARREKVEYAVGEALLWDESLADEAGRIVDLPDEAPAFSLTRESFNQKPPLLTQSGIVQWRSELSDLEFQYAVNIDASESNPAVVLEDAFVRALGSSALVQAYNAEQLAKIQAEQDDRFVKVEYGWWALLALLIGLMAEGFYASIVSRREWNKQANAEG